MSVGDVTNEGHNVLIVITADGWCYLYSIDNNLTSDNSHTFFNKNGFEQVLIIHLKYSCCNI